MISWGSMCDKSEAEGVKLSLCRSKGKDFRLSRPNKWLRFRGGDQTIEV